MKNLRRDISKFLVSKTLVDKEASQNLSKISLLELKKNKAWSMGAKCDTS